MSENKVLGYIHEDIYFDCGEWGDYLKANIAFSFSDKEIKKDILKFLKDFDVSKKNKDFFKRRKQIFLQNK